MFGKQIAKANVLIIDQDDVAREEMRMILSRHGYKVIAARTGDEGLARIDAQTIDVFLINLILPDMSGLDLLQQIKERDAESPVILMGTHITTSVILTAITLGAFEVVYKPFLSSIIGQRLDQWFSQHPRLRLDYGFVNRARSA